MRGQTKTRKMLASYYVGAPQEVKDRVAYIIKLPGRGPQPTGLTYEILLVEQDGEGNAVGIDLGPNIQGQHFFLSSVVGVMRDIPLEAFYVQIILCMSGMRPVHYITI